MFCRRPRSERCSDQAGARERHPQLCFAAGRNPEHSGVGRPPVRSATAGSRTAVDSPPVTRTCPEPVEGEPGLRRRRKTKEADMTWSDFYLICFAVGFLFSLLSFVAGGLNVHGHWPHVHGLHFHSGPAHAPGGSGPAPHAHPGAAQSVSPFNFFTIAIFLAWFGGTGYLLTRYSTIVFALALAISTAVGLIGASIVFV